ncbi:2'-5' RNA ligase family protein [Kitasatospora sp. NPDC056446]|uniref:2'-5' RNA ligase family protein n=1 Tax=Kitasatospora sp. NPDC056446 TaxID=3345819 RepID=UPI0036A66A65
MKRFNPRFGTTPWPQGLRVLQVYGLPHLPAEPALHALVTDLRTAMDAAPIVPVADERLHITLDMVTDAPAHGITEQERAALADALRRALASTAPVELQAGSAIAYRTGVLIDVHPDGELASLQRLVRSAIHEVRGPDSTGYPVGVLHLTAGYAAADTDTDALAPRLLRVRPSHVPLTVREVALVEVYWRQSPVPNGIAGEGGWEIDWTTVASFALGAAPGSSRSSAIVRR